MLDRFSTGAATPTIDITIVIFFYDYSEYSTLYTLG
jgi:hypothetical protein